MTHLLIPKKLFTHIQHSNNWSLNMGQLILGRTANKATETKKKSQVVKGLRFLDKKGYLKAHYSANELKQMLSSFGNLEQYLVTNDK